ncbi:hypothetical protein RJ639_002941 [Escallonia herrerae]|uniref:H15 domain-containing protein n=1 Tax=Escallonia herrerae TaxID=1293975 RepID=A0AA89AZL3_9ASTE|nr:hypothetical protein RJ639_002941 [Escallonia herrerae]
MEGGARNKFTDVVAQIANPNNLTAAQKGLLQQHLNQFFSEYRTPSHPPYAAMIQRAIAELNEEGGSSEDSILDYIGKKYADLPWAHLTMLKHHLAKLCDSGEIFLTPKQGYLVAGANLDMYSRNRSIGKQLKRKRRPKSGLRRSRGRKKVGRKN